MAEVINGSFNRTNLKGSSTNENLIIAYINQNASDALVEKINSGTKTMSQCMKFIVSQAKGKAQNGCAMIEDKEVFGWAMHFFEEDSIKADTIKAEAPKTEYKPAPKPEPKKVEKKDPEPKKEQLDGQMDIFALLGGM